HDALVAIGQILHQLDQAVLDGEDGLARVAGAIEQAVWRTEADCERCAVRSSVLFRGLESRHLVRIHNAIEEFELPPDG
ncbi:hypothetical protein, partial [Salmonella enterica]|uniref:hypothetical protein n=1 Tax=Salmonella enterica TaxID=28901 RepID=UPI0039E84F40